MRMDRRPGRRESGDGSCNIGSEHQNGEQLAIIMLLRKQDSTDQAPLNAGKKIAGDHQSSPFFGARYRLDLMVITDGDDGAKKHHHGREHKPEKAFLKLARVVENQYGRYRANKRECHCSRRENEQLINLLGEQSPVKIWYFIRGH